MSENGSAVSQRALRALEDVDNMPPGLRGCVHEFGFAIVHALRSNGISNPAQIRQLVHEIWRGARQPAQRGGYNKQPMLGHLDWLLLQAGASIGAKTLVRVLYQNSMVIVPRDPGKIMIDASMDAVNHMGVVSKAQKHRNRLRAAIDASTKSLWPHLTEDA